MSAPRLLLIVDRGVAGSDSAWLTQVARVLRAAPSDRDVALQLRLNGVTGLPRRALLAEVAPLVRRARLPVILGGDRDEADRIGAPHVHRTEAAWRAGPLPAPWPHSAAVHDVEGARIASRQADWLVFAPVFDARSKRRVGSGVAALRRVCAAASCPVLAVGGVTADNVQACLDAGARGVGVLSPISRPDSDVDATVMALLAALPAP